MTNRRFYKFIIFSILFALVTPCFTQSAGLGPEQRIDTLFSKYTNQTPGVAVAVLKKGEIIFSKGYGSANLEYNILISPKSVFLVGSVSKQFTAFSIYLLVQQGKLSLEDDIRKFLPELPVFDKPILVKHLCYHTSGLKEEVALLSFAGWRMDDHISIDHTLELISRQKTLNFQPGTAFKYSNTNYTLLGEIVRRVSGKSLAAFTKEFIFTPLGMDQSQFYDDHEQLIKNRAYSYDYEAGIYEKEKLNSTRVGSTGLFTTVEDLAKWANNFRQPIVGNLALIREFNELATLDNGEPALLSVERNIQHAKGQFTRNYRGINTYIHTGSHGAYRAYLGRFPDQELVIIVLSNEMAFSTYPTSMQILEFYLADEMTPKKNPANNTVAPKNKKPIEFHTDFSAFTGKFHSEELDANYSLVIEADQLILKHLRLGKIPLKQIGASQFSGRNYYPFQLEFIKDKNDKVIGFNILDFRREILEFHKKTNSNSTCKS